MKAFISLIRGEIDETRVSVHPQHTGFTWTHAEENLVCGAQSFVKCLLCGLYLKNYTTKTVQMDKYPYGVWEFVSICTTSYVQHISVLLPFM